MAWNAELHPRAPGGSAGGGEFSDSSKGAAQKGAKPKTAAKSKAPAEKKAPHHHGDLHFKAGYNSPHGDKRVKVLQTVLNNMGSRDAAGKRLVLDGKLGPKTTAAIKRAQRALGVKPTGIVSEAFLTQLKKTKSLNATGSAGHRSTKLAKTTAAKTATTMAKAGTAKAKVAEAATPAKPYGDVSYADPGYQQDKKKRYPLDSADHCRAAWSYINMPKNAGQYSPDQVKQIKDRIKAAAKRYGVEISDTTSEARVTHEGRIMEARGTDDGGGRVFRMRIIKYGDSRNRRRYPENVMRDAAGLYEGAKAYDHHRDDAELRSSTVTGLVGWYENVEGGEDGLYGDLHLLPSATKIAEAMDASLALQERKLPPLVGTSHDVSWDFRPVNSGGRVIQEAVAINAVSSVDIVANPAAGGQAVRAVAGGDDELEQEDNMTLEDMLAALATATDEQLATAGLARHTVEEPDEPEEISDEELEEVPVEEDKVPVGAGAKEALDPTRATEAGLPRDGFMVKMMVKGMVTEAKLPETMIAKVMKRLPERVTEADIFNEIKGIKDIYADLEKPLLLEGGGDRVTIAKEGFDKKRDALDAFFSGDFGKGYWSFRQAYMDVTGNSPRSFTEDFNRRILRESIGGYDSAERATESMDSSTWNLVLGDSITRRMVADYQLPTLQSWRQIVSQITPVNDFRTQRIDRIGGYGTLPAVNQGAAYQPLTSPSNEEVTYAVTKRGGTEDITLEMIANDDVRSISRIPTKLGRAAANTLFRFVWGLVDPAVNPTIYDGNTLYHSSHGNTNSTAFSQAQLSVVRQKMRDQAAYGDSVEILGYVPKILVVPNELEEHAWEVVTSSVAMPSGAPVGAASDVPNIHQGMTLVVQDIWTDNNNWLVIADPGQCPTIEMGFYQGRDTPELFTQSDPTQGSMFDADKLTYKIRHIYSGTVLDWRAFQGSIV
jgi:peptidoglycan hydrolase-like protein with peptidoglycan-binding domain